MSRKTQQLSEGFVLVERSNGHTVVPESTPLTRLNYYDGLFLRASHLKLEQDYFLELNALANQAGGSGLVHGFDLNAAGGGLEVSPGLGFNGAGDVLFLPQGITIGVADLLQRSQFVAVSTSEILSGVTGFGDCVVESAGAPDEVIEGSQLYLITASHAEALCGEEDVYGKLCEEACVTSTERPFRVDGLVFRARPLVLATPYKSSTAEKLGALHTRSLVAAAYFADEVAANPASISGAGLRSQLWCNGAVSFAGNLEVPLGILGRSGDATTLLDGWIARRERIGAPPRRYWAWKMAMRPWNVFLAQICQFQCHLRDALAGDDSGGGVGEDPCKDAKETLRRASVQIDAVMQQFVDTSARLLEDQGSVLGERRFEPFGLSSDLSSLNQVREELAIAAKDFFAGPDERVLVRRGIVETPSAGYLPVLPVSTVSVNDQVRKLLGDGVDLRFCTVRADFVPHALEEAQHMERICLLTGLDNPAAKPRVDVLVPEGRIQVVETAPEGAGYDMELDLTKEGTSALTALIGYAFEASRDKLSRLKSADFRNELPAVSGAARGARTSKGGYQLYYAGRSADKRAVAQTKLRLEKVQAADSRGSERRAVSGLELLKESVAAGFLDEVGTGDLIRIEASGAAVWLELSVESDPFDLASGQSTPVDAVVGLTQNGQATELFLDGSLRVVRKLSKTSVELQLDGRLTVRWAGENSFADLDERLTLARSSGSAGAELSLAWHQPKAFGGSRIAAVTFQRAQGASGDYSLSAHAFAATASQKSRFVGRQLGQPTADAERLRFNALAAAVDAKTGVPLLSGGQQLDERALLPGSGPHDAATDALSQLAAVTRLRRYSEEAPKKLFPPAPEPTSELTIEATRDWVFFHRRRDKQCGIEQAPPARVLPRRYRVFHAEIGDAEQVERLREQLAAGGGVADLDPRFAGEVEFAGGNSTLITPLDLVRQDWDARADDGVEILYAAIASVGDAVGDGEVLSGARLGALGNVLDSVTPIADEFQMDVLPVPPAGLQIEPADGVILLLTLESATVCHTVFRLEGGLDEFAEIAASVGSFERFKGIVTDGRELQELGTVEFRSGKSRFASEPQPPVEASWQEAGDGSATGVIVFQSIAAGGGAEEPASEQAIQVWQATGSRASDTPPILVKTDEVLAPCGLLTVLVAEPQVQTVCNEVVVLRSTTTEDVAASLLASATKGSLPIDGRRIVSLGAVDFDTRTNEGIPESLDRLVKTWNELVPTGIPQDVKFTVGAIAPQGTPDAVHAQQAAQSSRVAALLGSPAEAQTVVFNATPFPSAEGCPAITFLILTSGGRRFSTIPVRVETPDATGRKTESVDAVFRFDENSELIRDESFDKAVAVLQKSGAKLDTVEFAGSQKPRSDDKRLRVLVEALTERGVASSTTTASTTKVGATDRGKLKFDGFEMPTAFVLKAKRG